MEKITKRLTGKDIKDLIRINTDLESEFDEIPVKKALAELEALRNEDWTEEFIRQCIQEFRNLRWSTAKAVEGITKAKFKKQFGVTKFSDFVEEETGLFNDSLVLAKARILLEREEYIRADAYKNLLKHQEEVKNELLRITGGVDEECRKIEKIKEKKLVREKLDDIKMDLFNCMRENEMLGTGCEKVVAEFFKELNIDKYWEKQVSLFSKK